MKQCLLQSAELVINVTTGASKRNAPKLRCPALPGAPVIQLHTDTCGRTNAILPRRGRAASFTRLLGSGSSTACRPRCKVLHLRDDRGPNRGAATWRRRSAHNSAHLVGQISIARQVDTK